jgi:hypothetical protein
VKARGVLLAAGAVLVALAVPAGAAARVGVHHRHIEVIPPSAGASVKLGIHGGYQIRVEFEEPDLAVLSVQKFDWSRLGVEETNYGAHFRGSLVGGRVTADFGAVGSFAVRFRPAGPVKKERLPRMCEGRPSRIESGRWVGKFSLRGEGGYFAISTGLAKGRLERSFRIRCRVKRPLPLPRPKSLIERIEPHIGASIASILLGSSSSLEAESREHGHLIGMRAGHATGRGPGAEVEAGAFEYQGRMPVGRFVQVIDEPPGTLVTTLPGEHPASAILKPGAPFSGEASYLAVSPTEHSWTGTLAVRFPGLKLPLTGSSFYSTLCVISPLVKPLGCLFKSASWQAGEESTKARARR